MAMINLSIGFNMADYDYGDPAGMCISYRDENKVSHIQNIVVGEKAELIYRLLTTESSKYIICKCIDDDSVKIQFL